MYSNKSTVTTSKLRKNIYLSIITRALCIPPTTWVKWFSCIVFTSCKLQQLTMPAMDVSFLHFNTLGEYSFMIKIYNITYMHKENYVTMLSFFWKITDLDEEEWNVCFADVNSLITFYKGKNKSGLDFLIISMQKNMLSLITIHEDHANINKEKIRQIFSWWWSASKKLNYSEMINYEYLNKHSHKIMVIHHKSRNFSFSQPRCPQFLDSIILI